jgi:type I restriction enzyme, R subunit
VQAQSRDRKSVARQRALHLHADQKFGIARGEAYPVLSARNDIIVNTDEAHRSQYDILAANMRAALPNAAFIGFPGTPLIARDEERTREAITSRFTISRSPLPMARPSRSIMKVAFPNCTSRMSSWETKTARVIEDTNLSEEEEDALARRFAKAIHQ